MTKTNNKSVLIVEDDQFIREMYAMILRKAGYEVTEAADGAAGLSEAQKGGFAVILLDLMMPHMDGLDFLREIMKHSLRRPNGAIAVLSNLAYSDAKDEALRLGAVRFLVKADLEPKEVVDVVNELSAAYSGTTEEGATDNPLLKKPNTEVKKPGRK